MIHLHDLSLGYGGTAVLNSVNLSVAAGDFLVIGGSNGGGKSTLLRGISGLIAPISGTIERGRTRFGYVPQQAGMDHALPLTGIEIVELGASSSLPWWKTIVTPRSAYHRQVLRDCQAEEFAYKPFGNLSGGQRQRVLLARSLATSPDLILLDEPTAGVDRHTQHLLAEMLAGLRLTIVLVTHEFAPFKDIATRFVWVEDGTLRELAAGDFHGRQGIPNPIP